MALSKLLGQRPELLPALTLAYIGDGVYELNVRIHLLELGVCKVDDLHKNAVDLVRAATQADMARLIAPDLTDQETSVMHRGRNAKGHQNPKSVGIATYRTATGLEALIGYWYLMNDQSRLDWFFNKLWVYATDSDKLSVNN